MPTSDGVIKAIHAGAKIETISAAGKTSDGLIKIGHLIIGNGGSLRVVDSHHLTSDGLIKVHRAFGAKVTFEGA